MNGRRLSLKRETLTELTADALTAVVGAGEDASGPTCPDCYRTERICVPTRYCPTGYCPTLFC